MPDRRPPKPPAEHWPAAWPEIVRAIRQTTRLALFIDFDGTLTRIQEAHATVRLSDRARRVLTSLASNGNVIGIVSGRTLGDITTRVGVARVWYVGDQGFQLKAPGSHRLVLASRGQQDDIARAAQALRARLNGTPGVSIEKKLATLTVHFRGAPRTSRVAATRAVQAVVRRSDGLRLLRGKQIWEVLPDAPIDKARAVSFIRRLEHADTADGRWLPIYVGDDVADERVFKTWRGLSVAVGRRHRTAARYYVRSPSEVHLMLEMLARIYS
jgi:trehalose 6-phosphate phosphatase